MTYISTVEPKPHEVNGGRESALHSHVEIVHVVERSVVSSRDPLHVGLLLTIVCLAHDLVVVVLRVSTETLRELLRQYVDVSVTDSIVEFVVESLVDDHVER